MTMTRCSSGNRLSRGKLRVSKSCDPNAPLSNLTELSATEGKPPAVRSQNRGCASSGSQRVVNFAHNARNIVAGAIGTFRAVANGRSCSEFDPERTSGPPNI